MLGTLGIIQACFTAPRFQRLVNRRLGSHSLLEWVARRMTESMQLDGVIVLVGSATEQIAELVPPDIPVFVGSQATASARFCKALEEYPARAVVRVRGDNPFVDPFLIDRLVVTAESGGDCDYAAYGSRDGQPAVSSPVGICAEWFRTEALRRAMRGNKSAGDPDDVTYPLHSQPEKFDVRLIPAPAEIDRDDVRLVVDIEEDWEHALAIFDALGPEEVSWQTIVELLDHQPALRRRMAVLNREYCGGRWLQGQ